MTCVLVIDDSPEDRLIVRMALEGEFSELREAGGGREGIKAALAMKPDCVILDNLLPDMGGLDVLRALVPDPQDPPFLIIMLTGIGDTAVAATAMQLGAQDYVEKDRLRTDDLGRIVRAAVERHRLVLERTRHERALRDSERRLNAVLDNASVAIFMMDERQHCIYMNAAAEKLTGYPLSETLGRPLHDVIHHTGPDGSHHPLAECPIDRAFPENNRKQGEDIFVHKDGSFYPVAFTASRIRDEEARSIGTIIEVRDIRAEKVAAAALRDSQERLALALRAGGLGVHDYDPRTGDLQWDAKTRELWGVSPDEKITYETFIASVHPDDRAIVQADVDKSLDPAQGGHYRAEYRVINRADRRVHWILADGTVTFIDGLAVRVVGRSMISLSASTKRNRCA